MPNLKKCPSCGENSLNTVSSSSGWILDSYGGTYDNPSTMWDRYVKQDTIQNICKCGYKSDPYTVITDSKEVQGGESP